MLGRSSVCWIEGSTVLIGSWSPQSPVIIAAEKRGIGSAFGGGSLVDGSLVSNPLAGGLLTDGSVINDVFVGS